MKDKIRWNMISIYFLRKVLHGIVKLRHKLGVLIKICESHGINCTKHRKFGTGTCVKKFFVAMERFNCF